MSFPILTVTATVPLSSMRAVMAARGESFTLLLLPPKPTFTMSHLLTCREIISKAGKRFLLDAPKQLPCLPAPEKCPSASGSKQQLHQTAQVFSGCSRGCHSLWLLQCGPQWSCKMTTGGKSSAEQLTDWHSLVLEAEAKLHGMYTTSSSSQHMCLAGVLHTSSLSFEDRSLFPVLLSQVSSAVLTSTWGLQNWTLPCSCSKHPPHIHTPFTTSLL